MKKKVIFIFIFIIILFIVLLSITVLATRNMITYTKSGKPIVKTGEPVSEEIKEKEFSLAVPLNEVGTNEETLQKEKDEALNKINLENIATISEAENEKIKEEIDISTNKKETLETENEFVIILKKYFGSKETEDLFNSIKKETDENNDQYIFPENGKKLLRVVLDIIDNSNATKEEVNILKKVVQSMDLTTLEDTELLQRINRL